MNAENARDCQDRIDENADALRAILECAAVIFALERAKATPPEGSLQTGLGFAGGYQVSDASLPDLLFHGTKLVAILKEDTEILAAAASARRLAGVSRG